MSALVSVKNLDVLISTDRGDIYPVRKVSFEVERGKTLSIVGESGSGKSMTVLALMDLLPKNARRSAKEITFDGLDMMQPGKIKGIRGKRIGMVFQDPMTSLNPVYTVGTQLCEAYRKHSRASRAEARERALFLLEKVQINNPRLRLTQYPHQLSGGIRQRVMIAMALMCDPDLIIADEPTTALDVTTQMQILELMASLGQEFGTATILITHDIGVVANFADTVAVMYAGQVVEQAAVRELIHSPCHPYTRALLECIPVPCRTPPQTPLRTIAGVVPVINSDIKGCAFRNRCPHQISKCESFEDIRALSPHHTIRCLVDPNRFNHAEI